MQPLRVGLKWNRLTITFSDDRPESEVTVAGALARAAQVLRRRGATANVDAGRAIVRFSPGFWGSKWMRGVMDRQISVTSRGGRTVVDISASAIPLVVFGAVAAYLTLLSLSSSHFAAPRLVLDLAAAALAFAVMAGGNYAAVHGGMKRLLRETLSPREHWSSFEASRRQD